MKTFDIAELSAFHPLLNRFLEQCHGSFVSGTVVLTTVEAARWIESQELSLEEHHMRLVDTIRGIAAAVNRPQRVPTFKEFDRFWMLLRDEVSDRSGGVLLVADPASADYVNAVVAHEAAASAGRIPGPSNRTAAV